MRRVAAAACAMLWHVAAGAAGQAGAPPACLAGYWSTDEALFASAGTQLELVLQEDGLGLLVGSQAARRVDGVDDGKPPPRAVIGYALHATLADATLTLRPFLPDGKQAGALAGLVVTCRHDAAAMTLACDGAVGQVGVMRRLDTPPPADAARMLDALRARGAARP